MDSGCGDDPDARCRGGMLGLEPGRRRDARIVAFCHELTGRPNAIANHSHTEQPQPGRLT
ncbi:MAG TPA: hypothetical protein VGV88_06125 [Candidatus Dormibacteraeota bacterium]|nr:hypothetical protein [Candidatus Dormibacteraeota bacterium]